MEGAKKSTGLLPSLLGASAQIVRTPVCVRFVPQKKASALLKLFLVVPSGLEPCSSDSQSDTLPVKLKAPYNRFGTPMIAFSSTSVNSESIGTGVSFEEKQRKCDTSFLITRPRAVHVGMEGIEPPPPSS